jgi:hypothetical protein
MLAVLTAFASNLLYSLYTEINFFFSIEFGKAKTNHLRTLRQLEVG